jgi:hypothetical protein
MTEKILWPESSTIPPLPDYRAIAELPPGFDIHQSDELLESLPKLNANANKVGLGEAYAWHLEAAHQALEADAFGTVMTPAQAAGLIGRLDLLIGSVLVHDSKDTAEQAAAQEILPKLGERANTVPCGTIFTLMATKGVYTGSETERRFRQQIQRHTSIMDLGIAAILGAAEILHDPKSEDFSWVRLGAWLQQAAGNMEQLAVFTNTIGNMPNLTYVRNFMTNVQIYFKPVTIGGTQYRRASGAFSAALAFENIVQANHEDYPNEDFSFGRPYLTPNHRAVLDRFWEITDGQDALTLARNQKLPDFFVASLSNLLFATHIWRTGHYRQATEAEDYRGNSPSGFDDGFEKLSAIKNLNLSVAKELGSLVNRKWRSTAPWPRLSG